MARKYTENKAVKGASQNKTQKPPKQDKPDKSEDKPNKE